MRSPTTTINDSAGAAGAVAASDDGSVAESPDAVAAAADEAVSPPADDDDDDDDGAVDLDTSWLVGMRCPLTCSARMCPWCAHSGSRPQDKGLLLLELPSPPLLLPGGRIAR